METLINNFILNQIQPCNVNSPQVLAALKTCPRSCFVPSTHQSLAYADLSIPLDHQQYMLTPKTIALMLEFLTIQPYENILEIGTGSGYCTSLLACLGKKVTSVEIHPSISTQAMQNLAKLVHNTDNINCITGNAHDVVLPNEIYDVIILTGSVTAVPHNILSKLKPSGRLLAAIGQKPIMPVCLLTFNRKLELVSKGLFETYIPPLENLTSVPSFEF